MEKELEDDCSYFKFTGCEPSQQYTFHVKVFGVWVLIIQVYHNETSVAVVSLAAVFVSSRSAPPHWTRQKRLWGRRAQQAPRAPRAYENSALSLLACLHFFSLTRLLNDLLCAHKTACDQPPNDAVFSDVASLHPKNETKADIVVCSRRLAYSERSPLSVVILNTFFSWFLLQAVSTKHTCDSDWSEPLVVTCPGAEKPLIKRIQSQQINCIRIGWERPTLRGSARVESFKVLYVAHRGAICRAID